jgi:[protein-PII] uridylyltransferase
MSPGTASTDHPPASPGDVPDPSDRLRAGQAALVADASLGGLAFGEAYAALLDGVLAQLLETAGSPAHVAIVALGSYARRELCPGSDVDVLLVHQGLDRAVADAIWYPLWDAGVVVGHAARTPKDAVAVAKGDLAALTSMLDVRCVAGDWILANQVVAGVRELAVRRQREVVEQLAGAFTERRARPGPIAELLEPNLKDGAGGLRDIQSLGWVGHALGAAGGVDALLERGLIQADDPIHLDRARTLLLQARVALHRVTGRTTDELLLQDQDAVAAAVGAADADVLVRDLSAVARSVLWMAEEVWDRLLLDTSKRKRRRSVSDDRVLEPGIEVRGGRATLTADAPIDGSTVLRLAAVAAEQGLHLDRASVARLAGCAAPAWDDADRARFVRVLDTGDRAVPVLDALDRVGGFAVVVPGWERVRSLPQRNAYHSHTVDRHLLEAVARCHDLFSDTGFDGQAARALPRPHLLLLGALFHDIGKGLPGDHSDTGAEIAEESLSAMGFPADEIAIVARLVSLHLLMPDVATRRDLSEEAPVARVARLAGTVEVLTLLYLLTIGDSIATGTSAWSEAKAVLVRDLFVKARHLLERGEVVDHLAIERRAGLAGLIGVEAAAAHLDAMPAAYVLEFEAGDMVRHRELLDARQPAVEWQRGGALGLLGCAVVAPDTAGILSAVAGVFTIHGIAIRHASVHTRADGMALEVYRVVDHYDRLDSAVGRDRVARDILTALDGSMPVRDKVEERAHRYASSRRRRSQPQPPVVDFFPGASDFATVVEVHADDEIGLLYRITQVILAQGLDIRVAKVATIGDRIVDTFYLLDTLGRQLGSEAQQELRTALFAELGVPLVFE